MSNILPKPYKYKDWLIWENTSFDNMAYNRVGCSDTINGVCLKNLSIKDCIEQSTDGIGYHIKFKNDESICVPIRTELYPNLDIIYKLESQKTHKELDDVVVTTFLNNNKYNFPPKFPNAIFFFDILQIKNNENNLFLGTYSDSNRIKFFEDGDKNIVNIQLIPTYSFASNVVNYEKINYGDTFNIILPNTSMILVYNNSTNLFEWNEVTTIEDQFVFQFSPLINGIYDKSKENTPVCYGDTFKIIYSLKNTLSLDNKNNLQYDDSLEILNKKDIFTAISKMLYYYCDSNKTCNQTTEYKNDKLCFRDKNCLGLCEYFDNTKSILSQIDNYPEEKLNNNIKNINFDKKNNIIILIIILLVLLVLLFFLYIILRRKV